jgi:hypothetical protein
VAQNKPDAIVIGADTDRLIGRKGGLQAQVFEALAEHKVKLVTPIKTFDPEDQSDYMFLRFFGVLSEAESDIKSRRVRAAKEQRAKRGLSNSGNTVNFGYKRAEDGKLVVDEYEAPIVRWILETYVARGLSQRGIALEVRRRWPDARSHNIKRDVAIPADFAIGPRPFTVETVTSICKRARFYAGYVSYKGHNKETEWFEGQHEAIIDITLAERCEAIPQTRYAAPQTSGVRQLKPYLFTKMIRCFACGSRLVQDTRKGKAKYRGEARRRDKDCQVCRGCYVDERAINNDLYQVMEQLRDLKRAEIEGHLEAILPKIEEDNSKRIASLKDKRRRLKVAYLDYPSSDPEERARDDAEYRAEIERVERELAALTPAPAPQVKTALDDPMWELWGDRRTTVYARGESVFDTVVKARQTATTEELRQFFARILDAIFVDAGDKSRPIRFVAPKAELRPFGTENVYVGYHIKDGDPTQEPEMMILGQPLSEAVPGVVERDTDSGCRRC